MIYLYNKNVSPVSTYILSLVFVQFSKFRTWEQRLYLCDFCIHISSRSRVLHCNTTQIFRVPAMYCSWSDTCASHFAYTFSTSAFALILQSSVFTYRSCIVTDYSRSNCAPCETPASKTTPCNSIARTIFVFFEIKCTLAVLFNSECCYSFVVNILEWKCYHNIA